MMITSYFVGFSDNTVTLNSPENSQGKTLAVNILRGGGAFGIIEVKWNAFANGENL